ncbi:MAG: acetyl-CoA carboxylase biotin carboxyl carrier protein subunit [Bryobacterales bacterium]|nr:acetyl-CoA carboxylase biotin carboxyl carrier protein subunit [Bryobacterales bacterium]
MIVRQQWNGEVVSVEFRVSGSEVTYRVIQEGKDAPAFQTVSHVEAEPGIYSLIRGFRSFDVRLEHAHYGTIAQHRSSRVLLEPVERNGRRGKGGAAGPAQIKAAMPGRVIRVLVSEGEAVREGQGLVVLEAMKMQNEITAPRSGTVRQLSVAEGAVVAAGALLCLVEGLAG